MTALDQAFATIEPSWQWRLSVERYHQMIDAGILGEDDRVELLEGFLTTMPPQHPPHAFAVSALTYRLTRCLGDLYRVRTGLPLTLARSEPEPDLAVVSAAAEQAAERHPHTAYLVIEVAESSLSKDRIVKSAIYAAAGIPEYWIVDLDTRSVEVQREPDPAAARYRFNTRVLTGEVLVSTVLPEVSVSVAALFRH
jgi:Uma2 family endonuclease